MTFNVASIISLFFVVFSIAALFTIAFNGKGFFRNAVKKYMIAAAAVYVSGTLLVAILYLFVAKLPMLFVFVSEAMMLFIFAVTEIIINKIGKNIDDVKDELDLKKEDEEDI